MKNNLIFIILIFFLILFVNTSSNIILELFENENYIINIPIGPNISLKDFNKKFNINIIDIPKNTALIGFDLDLEEKFFNFNYVTGEYKYLLCTLDYWMKYIHEVLNKRKYYFLICYVDGFKFDEIINQNFIAYNITTPLPPLITFSKRWNDKENFLLPDPFYTCKNQHT